MVFALQYKMAWGNWWGELVLYKSSWFQLFKKKKSVQFRKARMSPDWSIFKYTYICIKSCKLMNSVLVEDVLYALNAFSTPLRKI